MRHEHEHTNERRPGPEQWAEWQKSSGDPDSFIQTKLEEWVLDSPNPTREKLGDLLEPLFCSALDEVERLPDDLREATWTELSRAREAMVCEFIDEMTYFPLQECLRQSEPEELMELTLEDILEKVIPSTPWTWD